jgi:hypothetical protein
MNNKYHSQKVKSNGLIFDSQFEYATYQAILSCGINEVKIYYPIRIFHENSFFPELNWKCDFYLPELDIYIESKGFLHRDFKLRMMLLTTVNPYIYRKLILVTYKPMTNFVGNKTSLTLPQLKLLLRGKIKV